MGGGSEAPRKASSDIWTLTNSKSKKRHFKTPPLAANKDHPHGWAVSVGTLRPGRRSRRCCARWWQQTTGFWSGSVPWRGMKMMRTGWCRARCVPTWPSPFGRLWSWWAAWPLTFWLRGCVGIDWVGRGGQCFWYSSVFTMCRISKWNVTNHARAGLWHPVTGFLLYFKNIWTQLHLTPYASIHVHNVQSVGIWGVGLSIIFRLYPYGGLINIRDVEQNSHHKETRPEGNSSCVWNENRTSIS